MKRFEHVNAASTAGAVRLLGANGRARPIAGGTDLLSMMKLGIAAPERLVNLKTIPGLDGISFDEIGGLRLGALATLDAIAGHDEVRARYPLLAEAISLAASPQLRNQGTIGGNLAQDSRCWYYRGPFHCWLKGGETCDAKDGENTNHAIFGGGPCYTVHPSDPAPALVALGAEVRIVGPQGERTLALEQLFQTPRDGARRLTALGPSEIVAEIRVPPPAPNSRGNYLKAMERKVWAFALASVAVQVGFDEEFVEGISLVLGGVAPVPWRVLHAEEALLDRTLDDSTIGLAADLAVAGAQPLRQNQYKIALVKGLITQALTALKSEPLS